MRDEGAAMRIKESHIVGTLKKCKCGKEVFRIYESSCCSDCIHNDAWDEQAEEFTDDVEKIERGDLERTYVEENGECNIGSAHGEGCILIVCAECKEMFNIPYICGC